MLKRFDKLWVVLKGQQPDGISIHSFSRTLFALSGRCSAAGVKEIDIKRLKPGENTTLVGAQLKFTTVAKTQSTTKKKMTKLTEQERSELLQPLLDAGWSLVNGRDAIYREFIFNDFNQSFRFMTGVALLAEKMNHHPEWFNVYNKLQVTMSTHDVGGLSAKDIRMAKYMEEEFKRFV